MERIMQKSQNNNKVIFLLGEICSGKDTYANNNFTNGEIVVSIGDIVRKISNKKQRISNKDLDQTIIKECKKIYESLQNKTIVFVGIRQEIVYLELAKDFEDKQSIILTASSKVLKDRYESRGDEKDKNLTYEQAHNIDLQLGLFNLIHLVLREERLLTVIKTD